MYIFFFFNDTATTEIYTLSLHDALPISMGGTMRWMHSDYLAHADGYGGDLGLLARFYTGPYTYDVSAVVQNIDRKSTRLNSSHSQISYAVFCLKKKKPIEVM